MSRHLPCALLALAAFIAPAHAQTVDTTVASGKPLSVGDAVGLAMKKNFDLQIQAYSTDTAKEALNVAKAGFDPNLTASATRNFNQSASNTSRLDGTQASGTLTDNTALRVGATQKLEATNGTLGLSTNLSRGGTNTSNALLNPTFGSGVSATLSQPLLRTAGKAAATATIERSKIGIDIASLAYTSRILTVIAATENAYYNLVSARETVRIRKLTLDRNLALFEENKARRTTGVMTDLDVLTAEFGVATARRALVQAEQSVADREDALLNLINIPDFDSRPGSVAFDDYKPAPPNFALSYKLARERYPDSLSQQDTIKQLEIDLATAKRALQPLLNLDAGYGYSAKATDEGYDYSYDLLRRKNGNNWSLGLTYSMPWGQHADKANYRSAQINVRSQKVRLEQLDQSLVVSVRTAVRAVEANLVAVDLSAKATELSAKQYDLQKARFDAGLSTSRLVLQAQEDLETARFNELAAKLALRQAITEVNRLEGSSITRYGVQLPQ